MLRALPVAAVLLLFIALAGPVILRTAMPFLSLLPPGALLQCATGVVTTVPLLLGSLVLALGLGRVLPGDLHVGPHGTALAVAGTVIWEALDIGLATMFATGPIFLLGRVAGFALATSGAVAIAKSGRRRAKGLAPAAASLARGSKREER